MNGTREEADNYADVSWLGAEKALSVIPSVATLRFTRSEDVNYSSQGLRTFVGFGDPDFGQGNAQALRSTETYFGARGPSAEMLGTLSQLPASAGEIRELAKSFGNRSKIFLGSDASEFNVYRLDK